MKKINSSDNSTIRGITIADVLLVVFVVLKLCHVIDWSWWWVLSPIWICWSVDLIFVIVVLIIQAVKRKKSQ